MESKSTLGSSVLWWALAQGKGPGRYWMDGWVDLQMDGGMDEGREGRRDGWNRWIDDYLLNPINVIFILASKNTENNVLIITIFIIIITTITI